MKAIFLLAIAAFAAIVVSAKDECGNCPVEEGKCGCCVYPCCCKCLAIEQNCPTTTTTSTYVCPCVDLVFIVDASGSIGSNDWTLALEFMQEVVNKVEAKFGDECGDVVNVAVITFGNNATVNIPLTTSSDAKILEVPQAKKMTNIVEGMEKAIEVINEDDECPTFVVIITDGRSNYRKAEIPTMGQQLQDASDDVVCIGITSNIDEEQLKAICPSTDRQMSVNAFDELVDLIVDIIGEIIFIIPTKPSSEQDCDVTEDCFCCCPPPSFIGMYYNNKEILQ